jgi:hypothetical protein
MTFMRIRSQAFGGSQATPEQLERLQSLVAAMSGNPSPGLSYAANHNFCG